MAASAALVSRSSSFSLPPQVQNRRINDLPAAPDLSRTTSNTHVEPPDPERQSLEENLTIPGGRSREASGVEDDVSSVGEQYQNTEYKPVAADDQAPSSVSNRKNNNTAVATILADCAAVVLPIGIIVFRVLVWCLDGSPVGDSLSAWRNSINVIATAFPILFASIIGRLMSESARWNLERGNSLGLLEQLMGSRTVGSTLVTLFTLRTLNLLAAALLCVWVFSPLGAQAILRMLDSTPSVNPSPAVISYFDTRAPVPSWLALTQGSDTADGPIRPTVATIATLYTCLVGTPKANKVDTMDLWGNVRVPFLVPGADDAWRDASNISADGYSSLTGIPIHYLGNGNATFSLESSHAYLTCPNSKKFPANRSLRAALGNISEANVTSFPPGETTRNGTCRGAAYNRVGSRSTQWGFAVDRFIDTLWHSKGAGNDDRVFWSDEVDDFWTGGPSLFSNEEGIDAVPTRLLLRMLLRQPSRAMKTLDSIEIFCDITQQYVESRVECSYLGGQWACKVTRQRPLQRKTVSEHITLLSFPWTLNFLSNELPVATGRQTGDFIDPSLYYLKDPTFENVSAGSEVFLDELDISKVGMRFGQLLNTYIALSQLYEAIASTRDEAKAVFEPKITLTGEASTLVETFAVSRLWIILSLLAAVVLLTGGILSVVITHLTYGPEILGYVSTMIRNSKFIDLPSTTTWLDGTGLTNEMKTTRIRYGFIRDAVGEPVVAVGHEDGTERIKNVVANK
ncbi:hypothetical protein CPLU01_14399 [Colletotrichum plurivorum]|uniref:Uncharacterized protein n=1 Tax=Colletotrichum plurivorum TaxID=2175906 RepID=A0A8H6MZX9_9PEZI|nr:hypothetical protein CPLU01_14399 [Colletotrichum plurivorum]